MANPIRVVVWNEFRHEKKHQKVKELYPDGLHAVIAKYLGAQEGIQARTKTNAHIGVCTKPFRCVLNVA